MAKQQTKTAPMVHKKVSRAERHKLETLLSKLGETKAEFFEFGGVVSALESAITEVKSALAK